MVVYIEYCYFDVGLGDCEVVCLYYDVVLLGIVCEGVFGFCGGWLVVVNCVGLVLFGLEYGDFGCVFYEVLFDVFLLCLYDDGVLIDC